MTQQLYFWEFIEETRNTNSKEYMHPYVHCSVIYNSQDLEATQMSISKFILDI